MKDESKANTDILKSTDGVVTVLQSGGQYQVVIGNHVPDVYASVVSVGHLESLAAKPDGEEDAPKAKMNPFDTFISIVTGDLGRWRKDSFYWYQKVIQSNGRNLT